MKNKVLAIIVSYNGGKDIVTTIYALQCQVNEILVVDNASDCNSLEILNNLALEKVITLIKLPKNYGIGFALNIGVKKALYDGYDWVLTMDQDSIAEKNMVHELISCANIESNIVSVSPSLELHGRKNNKKSGFIDYAITSGNLVKTTIFNRIGFYNEDYFIDSIDFDFSLRVRQSGYIIYRSSNAILSHKLGNDAKKSIFGMNFNYIYHSPERRYYMYRNHCYLTKDFFAAFPKFITKKTILSILYIFNIIFFEEKKYVNIKMILHGIRDYFCGVSGKKQ